MPLSKTVQPITISNADEWTIENCRFTYIDADGNVIPKGNHIQLAYQPDDWSYEIDVDVSFEFDADIVPGIT